MSLKSRWEYILLKVRDFERWTPLVALLGFILSLAFPGGVGDEIKYTISGLFLLTLIFTILLRREQYIATLPAPTSHLVDLPCSQGELDRAIDLAQHFFKSVAMKPGAVRAYYRRNPFCVIPLKNIEHVVIGYVDMFGLKRDKFDALIRGELTESMLHEADLLGIEDIKRERRLYIGGIAVRSESRHETQKATAELLFCIADVLLKKYLDDQQEWEAYALGYARPGRDLLERLGFGVCEVGKVRRDHAPMYFRTFYKSDLVELQSRWMWNKSDLRLHYRDSARARHRRVIRANTLQV